MICCRHERDIFDAAVPRISRVRKRGSWSVVDGGAEGSAPLVSPTA